MAIQPPNSPAPPPAPQRPAPPPPHPATPPATPPNRPQGATVRPAMTYPPGSPYQEPMEREGTGPDPQEGKLRPYELAATIADDDAPMTIAQEQRARSEDIAAEGVEKWKSRRDERDPNDRPRSVAGVRTLQAGVEAERSTPPARAAQNKAAP